jgi:hypothetical protein
MDASGILGGQPDDWPPHDRRVEHPGPNLVSDPTRPPPASSIIGITARATRNVPVTFVSNTSRNPAGDTCQNGCGSVRKRGLTVFIPMPALLTSTSTPPSL